MKIEIEVNEGAWRQADAERKDSGDDLSRNFIWLRLPDDVRVGLWKLMGTLSLDELMSRGLDRETALKTMDLYQAMM